jgi:hypothetical protein
LNNTLHLTANIVAAKTKTGIVLCQTDTYGPGIPLTPAEVETLAKWLSGRAYLHSRPLAAPPSDELNFVE